MHYPWPFICSSFQVVGTSTTAHIYFTSSSHVVPASLLCGGRELRVYGSANELGFRPPALRRRGRSTSRRPASARSWSGSSEQQRPKGGLPSRASQGARDERGQDVSSPPLCCSSSGFGWAGRPRRAPRGRRSSSGVRAVGPRADHHCRRRARAGVRRAVLQCLSGGVRLVLTRLVHRRSGSHGPSFALASRVWPPCLESLLVGHDTSSRGVSLRCAAGVPDKSELHPR